MSKNTTLELLEDNLNKHMEICDLKRKVKRLNKENKRLRVAGYAMAYKINVHGIADQFTDSQRLVDDWSAAAKEGRDAK